MKKSITIMLAFALAFAAEAQINASNWVAMGCLGFNNATRTIETPNNPNDVYKTFAVNADIGAMYMLSNIIGIMAAVTLDNEISRINGDKSRSDFLSGPRLGARFYSPCFAPRFYTFAQAYVAMAFGTSKIYSGQSIQEFALSQMNLGILVGLSYFIIPALAMELQIGLLGWSNEVRKSRDIENSRTINNQFEFLLAAKALTVGITYWFGRSGQGY